MKYFYFVKACLIRFVKETAPYLLKRALSGLKSGAAKLSESIAKLKKLSKIQKVAFLTVVLGVGCAVYLVLKLFTGGLIKEDEKLFVHSMDELSGHKYVYGTVQMEDFYNSPRVSQNIMALRRIVVNLQKSRNAGANPMGAFEFCRFSSRGVLGMLVAWCESRRGPSAPSTRCRLRRSSLSYELGGLLVCFLP